MKKITVLLTILFLSSNVFGFEEGTDYIRLKMPIPNSNKTLIKVFNYECNFCYKYEKMLTPSLIKQLHGILNFKPLHIKLRGKYGKEASELFAVLVFKDIQNNISDLTSDKSLFRKAQMAYYSAHRGGKKETPYSDLESFLHIGFKAVGISKEEFEKLKNNHEVQNILKSWNVGYEIVRFKNAPVYIVNGKYLIDTQNVKSIGELASMIKELAKK
ncbi:MAG: thiol:disulfide interchange protein [Campylobacteraceae bacterium]|jgi:thiol:disulfide interchange protein DsbA|nr:thiol:disulfide interchange protein [Campylobacteraceae bacterium]